MVMAVSFTLLPSLFVTVISLYLLPSEGASKVVLEDGYAVSTVLDGDKLPNPIRPYSLLPRPGRTGRLLLLDSSTSTFYSLSFPISQDSEINRFSGNGTAGFSDGDSNAVMFAHPHSFTVDLKGNVYVADRNNHVIRKITESGVTTIAGGYSKKEGHDDGPAQNASFSNDFDLTFIPEMCALLISDRGTRLIRQMNLKPGDCAHHSPSGLGVLWVSLIGVLCSFVGLVAGFVARPLLMPDTVRLQLPRSEHDMEALPNQQGETTADSLLRRQKRNC